MLLLLLLVCRKPGVDCKCSAQGAAACTKISNSACNTETDACDCFPQFTQSRKRCVANCKPQLITDGSMVKPFKIDSRQNQKFIVSKGDEPGESSSFNVSRNNYRLKAMGQVCVTSGYVLSKPRCWGCSYHKNLF